MSEYMKSKSSTIQKTLNLKDGDLVRFEASENWSILSMYNKDRMIEVKHGEVIVFLGSYKPSCSKFLFKEKVGYVDSTESFAMVHLKKISV